MCIYIYICICILYIYVNITIIIIIIVIIVIIISRSYTIGIYPASLVEALRPAEASTDAELTKPAKLRNFKTSEILGLEQPRKKGG